MAVSLGAQPEHGFDQPLGLLQDCHRRIEKFLGVLLRITRETRGSELSEEYAEALAASLRYFRNAAPWHTRDEEESLFPRMRVRPEPSVADALAMIARLESDHVDADAKHAEIDRIASRWLEQGTLPPVDVERLETLLARLQLMYQEHIALEDTVIFPLAAKVLSEPSIKAIGREMAERRGLDPGMPERRCRHARPTTPPESNKSPDSHT